MAEFMPAWLYFKDSEAIDIVGHFDIVRGGTVVETLEGSHEIASKQFIFRHGVDVKVGDVVSSDGTFSIKRLETLTYGGNAELLVAHY